ncbi:MAG: septum formation initiator family protein [Holosporales bacterium]|nr:septum formation initiator family protein [Holosporales bacterium]
MLFVNVLSTTCYIQVVSAFGFVRSQVCMQLKFVPINRPSKNALIKFLILSGIAAYIVYHLLQGNRGLFALFRIRQIVTQEQCVVAKLDNDKEILLRDIKLLRPQSLDLDLLEERAREVLSLASNDEVVVNVSDVDSN